MSDKSGKAYTAARYDQTKPGAWISLLCEGYKLEGSFSLNDIADFVREHRDQHPGHILFATLDDERQAAYTSGHGTDTHSLDSTEGHDLSSLPRSAFYEDDPNEHNGYLTLPEEFPIRHSNFMKKAFEPDLEEMKGSQYWHEESYGLPLLTPKTINPDRREKICFVQIVPVKTAAEGLAAYPNGYFSGDFTPFQNFALANYISDNFGFNLFGIGASYLGFMSEEPLSRAAAQKLGAYLAPLSTGYKDASPLADVLSEMLFGQDEFYMSSASS